jgi:hypothetical protein
LGLPHVQIEASSRPTTLVVKLLPLRTV